MLEWITPPSKKDYLFSYNSFTLKANVSSLQPLVSLQLCVVRKVGIISLTSIVNIADGCETGRLWRRSHSEWKTNATSTQAHEEDFLYENITEEEIERMKGEGDSEGEGGHSKECEGGGGNSKEVEIHWSQTKRRQLSCRRFQNRRWQHDQPSGYCQGQKQQLFWRGRRCSWMSSWINS